MGQASAAVAAGRARGFPVELTSFVGRTGAVLEVAGLLEEYRLVTVTGPGGAGKTRLVDQVARRAAAGFADGTWLVELAPVGNPAQVPTVVAAALGVREQPGLPTAEALARVLARQQLLLVLDNCEHVVAAAAELCARLLAACDDMRILATSREPLAVTGEARYRLGPLSLPDPEDRADAAKAEAVVLFADRARSADWHFTLDDQTGPAVARLVRRLDGLPLAIELAAARVEALGVTGLLDRLDDRFELLAGGDRVAADRQRSLAATVAWSYQLLDDREQRVLRAVSIFPGPFTLEAAEAVAGEGAGLAVLHLVDCSLVVPPHAGPDGRFRYRMLETLRAYGARMLGQAGEQDGVAAALAEYALRVAEDAAPGLQTSTGELAAARWLDAEDATIGQALAWAVAHDVAVMIRLVTALRWWWFLRGRLAGEYPLLCEAAGRAEPGSHRWCAVQFFRGWTTLFSADLDGSFGHFTALRDAVADRPPSRALADALAGQAAALLNMGRLTEAADHARRSLILAREIGYPVGELLALAGLSFTASRGGDHHAAVQLARQAEQVPADVPGWAARMCSYILTSVLIAAGDLAAAERVCTAGLARARDIGDLWSQSGLLPQMAFLDVQAGRVEDATTHLREALQIAARTGSGELIVSLDCCGHLCATTGRFADAVTSWAAMTALLRLRGHTDSSTDAHRRDRPLRNARQALGPGRARNAEERGAAMSRAAAAEYALILTQDPGPPQAAAAGRGKLSTREQELVTLVAQGRTDAQIAEQLYISVRTVRTHLDRIREKTGCRRRADLTRLALNAGLI